MASIGLNIARDGSASVETLRSLDVTWVRVVAMGEHDLSDYFRSLRSAGIRILLVLARESFGAGTLSLYRDRYAALVDAVQVGNEADLTSDSSWTMTQGELAALGKSVRAVFPTTPLVCAGMASGHPEWLDGVDLSWCDALACHPYLKDAPSASDLEDLADMDVLVRAYRRYGKPVIVSEWGWWGSEEGRAAEEVDDAVRWAASTSDCAVFFYFCLTDAMVPPFGLLKADGTEKARAKRFRERAAGAKDVPWLPGGTPDPEPEPEPSAPAYDPWRYLSAEGIAAAAQVPLAAVRENWPRLVEQMTHAGIDERMVQIGMIGTVAKESASTFRPVREAFYLGEPEPAESYRRTLRYYPFYGRGFIQNTWEDSYRELGPKIAALWGTSPDQPDFDLISHPDTLLDPDFSAAAAAIFFRDKAGGALVAAARSGNWSEVRRLVLGGADPDGVERIARVQAAFDASAPAVPAVPTDPRDEQIAALTLALETLRDATLPKIQAQLDEAKRIAVQFVGPRSAA